MIPLFAVGCMGERISGPPHVFDAGPMIAPDAGFGDSGIELGSEDSNARCSDGADNDDDGFVDCDDFDCSRNDAVSVCGDENTDALCSDRVDNDGDGFVDCDDFDCSRDPSVTVCVPTFDWSGPQPNDISVLRTIDRPFDDPHLTEVTALAISSDGRAAVGGAVVTSVNGNLVLGDARLRLIDLEDERRGNVQEGYFPVRSVVFTPSENRVAATGFDDTQLFDISDLALSGAQTQGTCHSGRTLGLAWSADGTFVFSGGGAAFSPGAWPQVCKWNVGEGGREVRGFTGAFSVFDVVLSKDGNTLYASVDDAVAMMDPNDLSVRGFHEPFTTERDRYDRLSVLEDGTILAAIDDRVEYLDRRAISVLGHQLDARVTDVAAHPGWPAVAVALENGDVVVFDVLSGRPLLSRRAHETARAVAFSPDGRYLVSGGASPELVVYEIDGP